MHNALSKTQLNILEGLPYVDLDHQQHPRCGCHLLMQHAVQVLQAMNRGWLVGPQPEGTIRCANRVQMALFHFDYFYCEHGDI